MRERGWVRRVCVREAKSIQESMRERGWIRGVCVREAGSEDQARKKGCRGPHLKAAGGACPRHVLEDQAGGSWQRMNRLDWSFRPASYTIPTRQYSMIPRSEGHCVCTCAATLSLTHASPREDTVSSILSA
eukprot:1158048-Pelagomonas_calceolata.AAC.4